MSSAAVAMVTLLIVLLMIGTGVGLYFYFRKNECNKYKKWYLECANNSPRCVPDKDDINRLRWLKNNCSYAVLG